MENYNEILFTKKKDFNNQKIIHPPPFKIQ